VVDLGRPRVVATSVTPHSGVSGVNRPSTVPVRAIVFSKSTAFQNGPYGTPRCRTGNDEHGDHGTDLSDLGCRSARTGEIGRAQVDQQDVECEEHQHVERNG